VSTGARLKHPNQPTYVDRHGVRRFKANAIIEHLLYTGAIDLNRLLALIQFTDDDRAQFAQLSGYSVSGCGDLSYVTDAKYASVPESDGDAV